MRPLFIMICKVYGLMQVYAGLTYVFTVLPILRALTAPPEIDGAGATMATAFHGNMTSLTSISLGTMVTMTFAMAWLLIFRTEWLADRLNIPTSDCAQSPSVNTLLVAGTKLIGLYVIVQGLPPFVEVLFQIRNLLYSGIFMWSSVFLALTRLIIGGFLVMMTDPIVRFITREEKDTTIA